MRLRLLVDVYWDDATIPELQEMVRDQASAFVTLPMGVIGGRLMGAVPVEGLAGEGEVTK